MRVIVGGVFDLLHYGHLRFLKKAKEYGEYLIVAVNTDEFVQAYKGKKPVLSVIERCLAINELDFVDQVIINESNENWMPVLDKTKPQIIVTSEDWKDKDYYKQMNVTKEQLDDMKINLVYIPYTKEISTTKLLERIYERFSETKTK